jgi:hypothetical protein
LFGTLWEGDSGWFIRKRNSVGWKKMKGVSPISKGNSGLYIQKAWVSENHFCTGEVKVEEKSNEITAYRKFCHPWILKKQ